MNALKNRLLLIIGLLLIGGGYGLNYAAGKYQGLYRSLQYRNLTIEQWLTNDVKRVLLLLIGVGVVGILGHFAVKKRHLLRQKSLALFGILICGGQTLSCLSGQSGQAMGLYLLCLGYFLTLIGFILSLYEKEVKPDDV